MSIVYELRPHHVLSTCYCAKKEFWREELISINNVTDKSNFELYMGRLQTYYYEGAPIYYSDEFIRKIVDLTEKIIDSDNAVIRVVNRADDICEFCNRRTKSCEEGDSQESIDSLEKRFGVRVGDAFRMSEIHEIEASV
jgi:hypothetical protein